MDESMNKFYTFLIFLFSITFASTAQTYEQWISKSADHIERNRLDSAEYSLKKAIETDPSNPNNTSLLMSLGVIQRESGRYEDAYMTFTAALTNYPDSKLDTDKPVKEYDHAADALRYLIASESPVLEGQLVY